MSQKPVIQKPLPPRKEIGKGAEKQICYQSEIKACRECSSGKEMCKLHSHLPWALDIAQCNACTKDQLCKVHLDKISAISEAENEPSIIREIEQQEVITHQEARLPVKVEVEKPIIKSHQEQPILDTKILPPIIKEHHKEVIYETHQPVIHEYHQNIVHEDIQPIIYENIQPIIHQEVIHEVHQPVIHEQHVDVIHEVQKPVMHEEVREFVKEEHVQEFASGGVLEKAPIVIQEKPVAQKLVPAFKESAITEKVQGPLQNQDVRVSGEHVIAEKGDRRLYTEKSVEEILTSQQQQSFPIKLTKLPQEKPAEIIMEPVEEREGLGGMIKGLFSDIKHSVSDEKRQI